MPALTETHSGAQPDPWAAYDGLVVTLTDFPAIAADTQTFAEYLREQANYYLSLDSEYSHKVAEILEAQAARHVRFTPEQLEAYKPFGPAF